ncbi:AGAP004826-PA, partial [Anopheles gambiae str. PEST]
MPTTYNPNYENSFPWCSPDPKDEYAAVCKWCNKKIKINTMGRVALVSHEKSKAHHHQVLVRKTNLPISHFLPNQIVGNNLLSSSPSLSSISTAMATQISASDSS